MTSRSTTCSSRGRSNRRSPAKKAAEEDAPASADAPASKVAPKSPDGPPPARPVNTEDYSEKNKKPGRSKASGARKTWRQDGNTGTWTCPDCHRVILDHPAGIDQHKASAYHLSYPGHHLLILINILKQKSIIFIDFEPGFFNRKPARKCVENQ